MIDTSRPDTGPAPAVRRNASSHNINISQTEQNINTPAENSAENISAEKPAVFYNIEDVIKNGIYVGSGSYMPHGNKVKQTERFDYFESDVTINGSPHVVAFDVEIFPFENQYRTHKVYEINNIDLIDTSRPDTGPVPAVRRSASSLVNNISQTEQNINTPAENSAENISTNAVPTFETQQQAPASAPTSAVQQILPAATAQQETSIDGEKVDTKNITEYNEANLEGGITNEYTENNNRNAGADTELLERGEVSTVSGEKNIVREQGNGTQATIGNLGLLGQNAGADNDSIKEQSNWLTDSQRGLQTEGWEQYYKGILRSISGIVNSGKDVRGRILNQDISKKLENTVLKDKDGNIISVYHWTPNFFEEFKYGDLGYHAGTYKSAQDRHNGKKLQDPTIGEGYYKELFFNINNPIFLEDHHSWSPFVVATQLLDKGIITKSDWNYILNMPDSHKQIYDSVPMALIRELLHEKGYDGFAYLNQGEDIDSISFAVFYPEQIITVSENGMVKEGIFDSESSENISTNAVPSFETQQQAPASAPTSAVQQILPAAPTPQETSIDGEKVDTQNITEYNEVNLEGGITNEYTENNNRNAGADTELLERGEVSAADTYEDRVWKYGPDTAELLRYLGNVPEVKRSRNGILRAGSSGWIIRSGTSTSTQGYTRFKEGFLRSLQGIKLKDVDTTGRKLNENIKKQLEGTILKDENGVILSLYH